VQTTTTGDSTTVEETKVNEDEATPVPADVEEEESEDLEPATKRTKLCDDEVRLGAH
jgi:hypothetical protein